MLYPSIDKLQMQIGSKYLLVNVVSKMVKDMEKTGHYQLKENEYKSKSDIGKALEEITNDLVHIEN